MPRRAFPTEEGARMTPTRVRNEAGAAWLRDLHRRAVEWSQRQQTLAGTARTESYIDLIFAFGSARVGDRQTAEALLQTANASLPGEDDAHRLLLRAFEYRVHQACVGG